MKKVALVVGAGDYIGSAIAKRFARGGFTIAAGRRNGDKLQPLIEEIEAGGGCCHGFSLDARQEEQIVDRFAQVERDIGPIEVCVFNVGGNVRFPILDTTTRVFTKPDTLMNPASVGEAYWQLYNQSRDAWTFELDLRPFRETW